MYTEREQTLLQHAKTRIAALFAEQPAPGHGPDHAERVAKRAKNIALAEGISPFLCECSGWLHDVGRAPEFNGGNPDGKSHHELSYDMLRLWFQEDELFAKHLSTDEKLELLYGIRYHWNDVADKDQSAVILRDADKLDAFGQIGLGRAIEFCGGSWPKLNTNFRYLYQMVYWLQTDKAKEIFSEENLMEPITAYYRAELKKRIEGVSL